MRKLAPKAIFSILTARRSATDPPWDRIALLFSVTVTIGLAALYAYGKATSRW